MKKLLITSSVAMATLISISANAQPWTPSGGNIYSDPPSDNVGIGIQIGSAVQDKLTIHGNIGYEYSLSDLRHIIGRSPNHGLVLFANEHWDNGGGIMMHSDGSTFKGSVSFVSGAQQGPTDENAFEFLSVDGSGNWLGYSLSILKNKNLKLHGDQEFEESWTNLRHIKGKSHNNGLVLFGNDHWRDGSGIMMHSDGSGFRGSISFVSGADQGSGIESAFDFLTVDGSGNWQPYSLSILKNRNLMLYGDQEFEQSWSQLRNIKGRSHNNGLVIFANDHWRDGSGILLHSTGSGFKGSTSFVSGPPVSNWDEDAFTFLSAINSDGDWGGSSMTIRKNGKVIIGNVDPNTPYDYKLYVQNGILTERVKVAVAWTGDWSDYVFADDYKLMPLAEVEEYIKENKHLPAIPSAEEVVKEGIDLGAMDAKLLQKIEELTLHMIEQNKKIDAQQKEIAELKSAIK